MNEPYKEDPPPPLRRSGPWVVVVLTGLVWLALGTNDWWMRFHWFHWQATWIVSRATSSEESLGTAQVTTVAPHRGGDLSRLIGIPSVARAYEEARPGAEIWADEYGYNNRPPAAGTYYPIVVVGDSYMADGVTMEDTIPGQLAKISGVNVYNHGLLGWGSFLSIVRFLEARRFRERPPKVLLWGIIERDVSGNYFEGLNSRLYALEQRTKAAQESPRFELATLSPAALRRSLPNTSAIAQSAARAWNRIRYHVLGRLNPYIIPVDRPIGGRNVLFYYPSIDAMKWSPNVRAVDKVAQAALYLKRMCDARGIVLLVALIPDKEDVYRDYIPATYNRPEDPIPPSCLDPLETALRRAGVRVVNLLEPLRAAARKGELLYWADDTHWNPAGIALAARVIWTDLEDVVKPSPTQQRDRP